MLTPWVDGEFAVFPTAERFRSRLARLCDAWASLPEQVIIAILALVDSSSVVVAGHLQLRFRESWRPDAPLGRSGPARMSGNGSTPGQVP